MERTATLPLLVLLAACAGAPKEPRIATPEPMPLTTTDDQARTLYESGLRKADRMHHREAEEDLRAAVGRDPAFALAWVELANTLGTSPEIDECLGKATALRDGVTEGERLIIDAVVAQHEGRRDAVRPLYARLVELHPKDARAWYLEALTWIGEDDEREIVGLETAVAIDPAFDPAWNMLGYAHAAMGNIEMALKAHKRYVELLPQEPNAHDSYAETLMKAGRFEESMAEYEAALALDPSFTISRIGIGHNLVFLTRFDEARASYERAMQDAALPRDRRLAAEWLVIRAVYAGEPGEALRAAFRLQAMDRALGPTQHAMGTLTLARAMLVCGKASQASATAVRVMELLPHSAPPSLRGNLQRGVLRLRIEARVAAGNFASANSMLRKLRKLSAGQQPPWVAEQLHFIEGVVLLAKGDAQGAAEELEKASAMDPRALFHLAEAKSALGQDLEAATLYRKLAGWNSPSMGHALVLARARERVTEPAPE